MASLVTRRFGSFVAVDDPAKAGFVNRGQINVSTLTCVEAVTVKVQED
jgi:hypothetical protein